MLYFIYFFDFIIFFMSAYKTDIYYFGNKKNKNNQSKVVSFDIENKSAISYSIYTVKVVFNVCKTRPFCGDSFLYQSSKGIFAPECNV